MSKVLRGLGIAAAALLLTAVVAAAAVYLLSQRRLHHAYAVSVHPLAIPSDSATISHGRELATGRLGCTACHGDDLGGKILIDNAAFGRYVPANLTSGRGGIGRTFADSDWILALHHGVRPDGSPLVFMPSDAFSQLSAADLAAVIAYLKTVPPVDRELPPSHPGPIARGLLVAGALALIPAEQIDHNADYATPPSPGPSAAHGSYLVATGGCRGCHEATLAGGGHNGPDGIPAANLTPGGPLGHWQSADFIKTIRTGVDPSGHHLSDEMPWKAMAAMSDTDLTAIFAYLQTVPPQGSNR